MVNRRLILLVVGLIVIAGLVIGLVVYSSNFKSDEKEWQTINANGKFSFQLPTEMTKENLQATDSYAEKYNNEGMSASFDYGIYGGLREFSSWREEIIIDGKPATLQGGDGTNEGWAQVYIRNLSSDTLGGVPVYISLVMSVDYKETDDNKDTALKILKSIDFP